MKAYRVCFHIVVILILLASVTANFAGTTGKISGVVKDAQTNDPLPGCSVIIKGTTLGAACNANGHYFIINVPPGHYSVQVDMMGYRSTLITDVQVTVDLTTKLNFALESQVVQGDTLVVVAERPLVQKDVTSKLSIVGSSEITNMAITDFQDVLTTKAGFTRDAEGEIHVRGGRTGEIAYMIDGMYVEDPLYGGFNSMINEDAIDEMVVISGTFNAEYGDAMSSIVNIVTKDGGTNYTGKLEYTSSYLNKSPYREQNPFPGVKDSYVYQEQSIIDQNDLPLAGMVNASFSGPIPGLNKLSFFVSDRFKNEDSYLPHGYILERDEFGKLTWRFNPSMKLTLTGQRTRNESQSYNHAWKYRSDHQQVGAKKTMRLGLTWTHTISPNLFYTTSLSRYKYNWRVQVDGKLPADYEIGQTGETVYFYVSGDDADYADDQTVTYAGKFDMTWQANSNHQFKTGAELENYVIDVYEENEPWPSGAQFKERYERQPIELAAYLQDKIEYDYLILNIGLRFDYADPKAKMWPDVRKFGYFDENNVWIVAAEKEVSPKTQLSPRIGLAHPLTDRAVMHFSYGHFFQNPNYNSLYYNPHKDLGTTLPLVGNPALKAQKTVAYETGIKFQISEMWAFDITTWYKDITDLLSTLHVSYLSQDYVVFYNSDYASVKGVDLTLQKKYSNYLSGSIDYTYTLAKGNNSQPLGGYLDAFAQEEIPHQEYFLDFDQRHDFAVNFTISVPNGKGPDVLGFKPLGNINLNLLFQAGSGLPYTPYVDPTLRVDINSARKPWTSTLDIRLLKKISVWKTKLAAFVEATNLLDRENVVYVYSRTGKPFDTGLSNLVGSSPDADHNPLHVGPPRLVRAGVQFLW
ncbi:TonB-dependent receptor [candidate division KSB1 bacterium]|nr:TonB-dependent receptor [candidate division KSB1 bacterium]